VRLTAEELPFTPDLRFARALLAGWAAPNPEQARVRDDIVAFIDAHPEDAHRRTCRAGHLTASALVIDARGERALLTFHKKLCRWLQLGGHCDGDANLPGAALREAREESGIEELTIDPSPLDVDVHGIPPHGDDPAHLHLDTRFRVFAGPGACERMSAESLDLAWFSASDVERLETDDSVRRLFRIAFARP
jgi:8-oxo-dGTP pyrophosphatase MutT (NUDIX family)